MNLLLSRFVRRMFTGRTPDYKRGLARAKCWIESNSTDEGVWFSSKHQQIYQEVTGYLIPTLIGVGERNRAFRWAESLLACQRPDGAITNLNGTPYVFDTAQVMRGFLCCAGDERFRTALERAADYLAATQLPDGSFPDPYAGKIPTYIFLYCVEPWRRAAETLGRPDLAESARRCLDYYAERFNPADFSAHSHFFGYAAEALIDNGRGELAAQALATAKREIHRNGALNAAHGVHWICGPGQAQFAICFYKTGNLATGDRLLHWLMRHQLPSGGFLGAYGRGSHYFPDAVPSWSVKFFLDAVLWRIRRHFELEFPSWMDAKEREHDFRLLAIRDVFDGLPASARLLEIGCGNGRFLSQLRREFPAYEYHGLDLSSTLVANLPDWMHGRQGDMMSLPYPSAMFDGVLMIESLEHAPDWKGALDEALRVLKPGGRIAIVDKDARQIWKGAIMPWEQWFEVQDVVIHLREKATDVQAARLEGPASGSQWPIFVLWSGIRR